MDMEWLLLAGVLKEIQFNRTGGSVTQLMNFKIKDLPTTVHVWTIRLECLGMN